MNEPVYILGGGRTDFKRNLKKEGKTIRHLIIEAGKKALDDAKIDAGEIQAGAVGNFNAGQFTMLCWWLAQSSKRRCRRSMARMFSERPPIITMRNRNTAISCSRSFSGGSRKFISTSTALKS